MNDSTQGKKKGSRIARKFNSLLFFLYLVIILLSIPSTYFITEQQINEQANSELSLLVDMIRAVRNVVREDTRPHFLPQGVFYPPVVSSTVMAKTVASKFAKLRPEYYIRIISDNPLNKENLPNSVENNILARFRASDKPEKIIETGILRNQDYLISAAPAAAKKGCLVCHGTVAAAPTEIVKQYGGDSGFGYRIGDIVGASVVGVPLANLNELVLTRSLYIMAILTGLFAFIFLTINVLVKRSIITPLLTISEAAQAVSRGKINESINVDRNDEIGELAHSFELMRRSLIGIVKKMRAEKK